MTLYRKMSYLQNKRLSHNLRWEFLFLFPDSINPLGLFLHRMLTIQNSKFRMQCMVFLCATIGVISVRFLQTLHKSYQASRRDWEHCLVCFKCYSAEYGSSDILLSMVHSTILLCMFEVTFCWVWFISRIESSALYGSSDIRLWNYEQLSETVHSNLSSSARLSRFIPQMCILLVIFQYCIAVTSGITIFLWSWKRLLVW